MAKKMPMKAKRDKMASCHDTKKCHKMGKMGKSTLKSGRFLE